MGVEDRDWQRDAQENRVKKENGFSPPLRNGQEISKGLKWGPFWIVVFWAMVMSALYFAMDRYLQPKPLVVSASGDLIISRARDGHFYASGAVNGEPVNFLVDTGASLVTVSEPLARKAGLSGGVDTVFKTANGNLSGKIVASVPVTVGPLKVSGVRVAVGLIGHQMSDALLGQSFLSQFEIILQKNEMTLRKR